MEKVEEDILTHWEGVDRKASQRKATFKLRTEQGEGAGHAKAREKRAQGKGLDMGKDPETRMSSPGQNTRRSVWETNM